MVDYRKIYEEEHVINPHVESVLSFTLWLEKYKKFKVLENQLNRMADKGQFDKVYDRFDKRSQELARELGY